MQLRASGSYRWVPCAASARFTAALPEDTGDAAREGTCAAWVAERCINDGVSDALTLVGQAHANGWIVDREMALHVNAYVATIGRFANGYELAEVPVSLFGGMIVGTSDCVVLIWRNVNDVWFGTLYIIDLKYGRGLVEVTTPQIRCYAAGYIETYGHAFQGPLERIVLGIYQPRAAHPDGHFRTVEWTAAEYQEWLGTAHAAAVEAYKPDSLATPGPHCRYCPAAAGCDALARTCYDRHAVIRSRRHSALDAQQLAAELDFLAESDALLTARRTAIEAEAQARVERGDVIPTYTITRGQSDRKWKYAPDVVALALGAQATKTVPRTPAEVEREIGRKVPVSLTERTPTRARLTKMKPDDIERLFRARH